LRFIVARGEVSTTAEAVIAPVKGWGRVQAISTSRQFSQARHLLNHASTDESVAVILSFRRSKFAYKQTLLPHDQVAAES
jgi:hypothetical protein